MSHQSKFDKRGNYNASLQEWIVNHDADYANVRDRLEYCRNVILNGRKDKAALMLEKSYKFAVLSIQTNKDRHEDAFIAHMNGLDLKKSCLQTVYGGQKYGWLLDGLSSADFGELVTVIRSHFPNGELTNPLETVTDTLKGVSYRKGAFMLAMVGLYEYMCIDSNEYER